MAALETSTPVVPMIREEDEGRSAGHRSLGGATTGAMPVACTDTAVAALHRSQERDCSGDGFEESPSGDSGSAVETLVQISPNIEPPSAARASIPVCA